MNILTKVGGLLRASGLVEAKHVLRNVKGIGFIEFDASDVVRHPMVAKIIRAYDANKKKND